MFYLFKATFIVVEGTPGVIPVLNYIITAKTVIPSSASLNMTKIQQVTENPQSKEKILKSFQCQKP